MVPSKHAGRLIIATVVAWAGLSRAWHNVFAQVQTQATNSSVPFVGCKSGGQVGPLKAPTGKAKELAIRAELANRLAYYQAEKGFGILAPRGWYCYSIYGSSGSSLSVAPEPINGKEFSGPGIQITIRFGDTSGRVTVAQIIARVFPDYNWFVQGVAAEKLFSANLFPVGPYPKDRLTYRSNKVVEFETPPNTVGLGTDSLSMLRANSSAIRGVAILISEETNLAQASIRLSPRDRDLIQPIIRQVEKEAADANTSSDQPPTSMQEFHDPIDGVSFRYPITWLLNQGGGAYFQPVILMKSKSAPEGDPYYEPTAYVALVGRDAKEGPYRNTSFINGWFLYRLAPELSEVQCYQEADANLNDIDDWKRDLRTFGGLVFRHGSGDESGLCNEATEDVYATFHGGRCYLFEKQIDTTCPGSARRDITPSELRVINRSFDAVLQSVRIHDVPGSTIP